MKLMLVTLLAITVVIFLLAAGCYPLGYVAGTGPVEEKTYDYSNFTDVEVSSAIQYKIDQASIYSVTVSAHSNILERMDIHQSGKTLIVRLEPGTFTGSDIRVTVTLPVIERLDVSGASRGSIRGFKAGSDLAMRVSGASQTDLDLESGNADIDISGASKMNGKLKAGNLLLNLSGASRCDLEGSASDMKATVTGASTLEFEDLQLNNVNIELSGASRADIFTNGKLDLNISGASTLSYSGKPTLGRVDVSGASKIVTD